MKNTSIIELKVPCIIAGFAIFLSNCSAPEEKQKTEGQIKTEITSISDVERGKYLVMIGGCNDCHSPKIFTAEGPVPDTTKLLSGHPAGTKLPDINWSEITPGKWILGAQDLTSWVGPWGVSFSANLTPDTATGVGAWTPELFMRIMRTGKHMGSESGRPILPPMPWYDFAGMTDEDLTAVLVYLQSLPPISNKVPEPMPSPDSSTKGN